MDFNFHNGGPLIFQETNNNLIIMRMLLGSFAEHKISLKQGCLGPMQIDNTKHFISLCCIKHGKHVHGVIIRF